MGSATLLPSLLSVTRLAPQLRHHVTCRCSSFRTSAACAGWLHEILLIFCMSAAASFMSSSMRVKHVAMKYRTPPAMPIGISQTAPFPYHLCFSQCGQGFRTVLRHSTPPWAVISRRQCRQ